MFVVLKSPMAGWATFSFPSGHLHDLINSVLEIPQVGMVGKGT